MYVYYCKRFIELFIYISSTQLIIPHLWQVAAAVPECEGGVWCATHSGEGAHRQAVPSRQCADGSSTGWRWRRTPEDSTATAEVRTVRLIILQLSLTAVITAPTTTTIIASITTIVTTIITVLATATWEAAAAPWLSSQLPKSYLPQLLPHWPNISLLRRRVVLFSSRISSSSFISIFS